MQWDRGYTCLLIVLLLIVIAFGPLIPTKAVDATASRAGPNGTYSISGKVVNSEYDPIEGINVTVEGTQLFNYTDAAGKFLIQDVPSSNKSYKVMTQNKTFYGYLMYNSSHGSSYNDSVLVQDSDVFLGNELIVFENDLPVTISEPASDLNVTVNTNIVLEFEESLNKTLMIANFKLIETNHSILLKGEWVIDEDGKIFTFIPESVLREDTQYLISIGVYIRGLDGDPLFWETLDFYFRTEVISDQFLTPKIRIDDITVNTPIRDVKLDTVITIEFNNEMNTTATDPYITLTMSGSTTNLIWSLTWDASDKIVTLGHDELTEITTYTILVSKEVKTLINELHLKSDATATFTTEQIIPSEKVLTLNIKGEGTVFMYDSDGNLISTAEIIGNRSEIVYPGDLPPGTYPIFVNGTGKYNNITCDLTYDGQSWYGDCFWPPDPPPPPPDEFSLWLIGLLIAIVLIALTLIIILIRSRKKNNKIVDTTDKESK